MKKVIFNAMIAAVSMLLISTTAKAQKGFYVGAQAAPQLSVMFNKDDVNKTATAADYKAKFSFTIGAGGGYHFTDNLGVGAEVMYSVAKQRYINDDQEHTQQFNYLKVPVFFTYNTNPASKVMFTAKAGPQVGILLKSKISDADDAALNGSTKDQYNAVAFGAMAGAGARVRLTTNIFLDAGLRFDGSFNTENKKHSSYTQGRTNTYDLNTGIDIGVKYFF
jgi:opacity protein-like surface antigen